jgi:predicted permease
VVLLIACANVAGLMLARGAQRGREYALRGALGAGTGRLVQQIGVESLILAAGGSALGIALTYGGLAAIRSMGSRTLPRIDELAVDGVVLAFAVAVGVASALLAGLLPTWRLARPDLREAMGDGGRGSIGARGGTSLRRRLVVVEVAAAVVLLIGAGLLVKSFAVLVDQELGFDPGDRLAVQVFAYDYASPAAQAEFLDEAVRQMRAIPGVREVALTSNLPGSTDGDVASIEIEVPFTVVDRASPPEGQEPSAVISAVSDGYFDVLEIPLVSGRGFQRTDDGEAPAVLVISETLARRHFGDADPLGERLAVSYGRLPPAEIVGVARDVRPTGHASAPRPEIYLSIAQAPTGSITFVLEAERDAASLTEAAFQAIWTANPSQAIWGSATLESLLRDWLEVRRFNLILLSTFAGVALLLAAVGIYGLISYSVEQRLGELGIRRALGGNTATLLGMVVLEGAWLGGAGIAIGVVGALLLTRFLQGMLFGVEPTDPATFALLALAVLGVSTCAALVPALRAVRVDPVDALRAD